jgi:hypothetical protein
MTALETLEQLAVNCTSIPPSDTSVDRLTQLKIDPGEFQKARPLRSALEQFAKYLQTIVTDEAVRSKISQLPDELQRRIQRAAEETNTIRGRMFEAWKPGPGPGGGVVPPRWQPNQFQSEAAAVESRYADVYQLIETLREFKPSDVQRQIDELKELVVTAGLERQSTKDTTEQLEKAKQETAAYVLSDITVQELDDAIQAYRKGATSWLWILFISSVIAFRIAWWVNIPDDKILWWWGPIFPQPHIPLTSLDSLVNLGRKVLLLSAAFTVPILALRVYYTNLHNVVINRQRKISVNAFTKLYALMKESDPPTKVELVKQAAQTIFAQGPTGFLSKPRSNPELFDLVTSMIRTTSKSG